MKKVLLSLTLCATAIMANAQVLIDDLGDANATPDASAVLELRSDSKGVLIPRLTTTAINSLTGVEGMMVYDKDLNCFKGYGNGTWQILGDACSTVTTTAYTVSIADAPNVTEGSNQVFTVSISPAVAAGDVVTVEYVTGETTPVSATEDTDYTGDIGSLTFNPTDTSKNITITTADDTEVESNESYTIELSNITVMGNATASLGTAMATGIIEDNDATAPSNSFTETFNDQDISSSAGYSGTYNFTGADNTSWTCVARTSLGSYEIDGIGFMFRDSGSNYCDVTFPNGISTLTFDYRAGFTSDGDRKIDVTKNGTVIGTTGNFPVDTNTTTLSPVINVNESGSVTLRIVQASSKQAVIDNVTWTR